LLALLSLLSCLSLLALLSLRPRHLSLGTTSSWLTLLGHALHSLRAHLTRLAGILPLLRLLLLLARLLRTSLLLLLGLLLGLMSLLGLLLSLLLLLKSVLLGDKSLLRVLPRNPASLAKLMELLGVKLLNPHGHAAGL
jgi:hypothetical protein